MISKKAVFYSAMVLTFSNTLLQILGFIYRIIISRMAGAEGMGVYQLIFPYYNIIMGITVSGLTTAISRLSAEKHALLGDSGVRRLVFLSMKVFLALYLCIFVFSYTCSDWIAGSLLGDIRTKWGVLLLLPCLFFTGFENIFKASFYGTNRVIPPSVSELLEQTVRIIAVALFLYAVPSRDPAVTTALIVAGMIVSELFSSGILTFFFQKYIKRQPSGKKVKGLLRDIFAIAVPLSAGGLVINFLSSVNKIIIPQRLMLSGLGQKESLEAFGILFGMTLPLLTMPSVFITSLSTTIMPRISKSLALRNYGDVQRKITKTIHVTSLLVMPIIAIMIPLGDTLCGLLYRQPLAARHIVPLGVSVIFMFYEMISMSILNGVGLQRRGTFNMVAGSVAELALTYVLVARYGMNGYMVAFFASTVITAFLNMRDLVKKTSLRIEFRLWFLHPLLSSLVTGLFVNAAHEYILRHYMDPYTALICSLLFGFVVYSAILKLQGIHIFRYLRTLVPVKERENSFLYTLGRK